MAPQKVPKVKRYHGWAVVIFILGTLLPPLAVAARFGIGLDFFLNCFLTLCGYIPGHVHNFYIQNVRNNKNHRRTPKWAQRYGLVNTDKIKRNAKRSEWAHRYNDRLPGSTLDDAPYEEGQVSVGTPERRDSSMQANGDRLWNEGEESYYNNDAASSTTGGSGGRSGRWRYPANFEDAVPAEPSKKSKRSKKDRWARTEDAYSMSAEQDERKKRKVKRRKSRASDDTGTSFPEDPEGGLYGERQPAADASAQPSRTQDDDIFNHEL